LRKEFGRTRRTIHSIKQFFRFAARGFQPIEVILPSGNVPLSQAEFEHCCSLIDYYIAEKKQITPYCLAHGRSADLYDRGNVWEGPAVTRITDMLLSKHYNNVNRLRLIGWHFSSYRVFDLSTAVAGTEPNEWFRRFYNGEIKELPNDIDNTVTGSINASWRIGLLTEGLDKIIEHIPSRYLHSQPLKFGEIAGKYRGFLVNGDSQRYWSMTAVLYRTRILHYLERIIAERGFCRVMEIGAGYGGFAYQLKKIYGDKLQFIVVDLVESLNFSSCYLTTLLKNKPLYYKDEETISPENGLVFVPVFRSPEFFDAIRDIDLCINTISMNEMSPAQVEYYGDRISRTLSAEGVFFECNWATSVSHMRINNKSYLAPYFRHRISLQKTEVSGDGDLDLWSNSPLPAIEEACRQEYPDPHGLEIAWMKFKAFCRRY
jgi:hypothetical protein